MDSTPPTESELLASQRILSCLAKADGTAHDRKGTCFECELEKQLAILLSPKLRKKTYRTAFALAHVEGPCSEREQKILDKMQARWGIPKKPHAFLGRLKLAVLRMLLPGRVPAVPDEDRREMEIRVDTLKYAVLGGALGALAVPGLSIVTDLAVVGAQVKLVRNIGRRWGRAVDKKAARAILYALGLGIGARVGANALFQAVPAAGPAWGAYSAFISTWALGEAADRYFDGLRPRTNLTRMETTATRKSAWRSPFKE